MTSYFDDDVTAAVAEIGPHKRSHTLISWVVGALAVLAVVVLAVVASRPAPAMSDQQFADQFNRITASAPDTVPIRAGDVAAVVKTACQAGSVDAILLPPSTWSQVRNLLAESGRCGRSNN